MTNQGEASNNNSDYKNQNRDLIEDISTDCCTPGKYCTLKEILIRSPRDSRTLIQLKCIEKFKYERSKAWGRDIGWNEAYQLWEKEGFAERFAKHYRAGIRLASLYQNIMTQADLREKTSG